ASQTCSPGVCPGWPSGRASLRVPGCERDQPGAGARSSWGQPPHVPPWPRSPCTRRAACRGGALWPGGPASCPDTGSDRYYNSIPSLLRMRAQRGHEFQLPGKCWVHR
ncbi:unnamed protein product, partial [Gulo gulo]